MAKKTAAETQATSKAAALKAFLKTMAPDENDSGAFLLNDPGRSDIEVISTGALSLDLALGIGGLPRGRISELYGTEGGGKTGLALSVAAQAQKADPEALIAFIDAEAALNRSYVKIFGIDQSKFVVFQPANGMDALDMVKKAAEQKIFDVIILDSVGTLNPETDSTLPLGDNQQMGQHAKMMTVGMRGLVVPVRDSNAVVIFVNQLREKPGAYGNPQYTPGGRALRHAYSVRIELLSGNAGRQIKGPQGPTGQVTDCKVTKNKFAPPQRAASYELYFDSGISSAASALDAAEKLGVIKKIGITYTLASNGDKIGIGKEKARDCLKDNPQVLDQVIVQTIAAFKTKDDVLNVPLEQSIADADDLFTFESHTQDLV